MPDSQITTSYRYKDYEIFDLLPTISVQFETHMISNPDCFVFDVTEDMRRFIKEVQLTYCDQETPIKQQLFSDRVHFVDAYNIPRNPILIGSVLATLTIPRLIKKDELFYPKTIISKACIL